VVFVPLRCSTDAALTCVVPVPLSCTTVGGCHDGVGLAGERLVGGVDANEIHGGVHFADGGAPHRAGELLRQKGGVELTMVAYRGAAPAMTAIIAQEVDTTFLDPAVLMPHVRDGRMRALAVTGPQRLAALPDYPTLVESGLPGVEVENWYALLAPAGTPRDRIARIHAALSTALARPETMRSYVEQGQRVLNLNPEAATRFIAQEIDKWAEVVRSAGMKPE
jgi:tripartite-type tricarboxylate transporter receptor subunit TctC